MQHLKGDHAIHDIVDGPAEPLAGFAASDISLVGTPGQDTLTGTSGNDSLDGKAGDDVLVGGAGADRLEGGEIDLYTPGGPSTGLAEHGNDYIDAGAGADWADGSFGDDTVMGGTGNDTLLGGFGKDIVHGGAGDDVLYGNGSYTRPIVLDPGLPSGVDGDQVFGDAGNDTIIFERAGESLGAQGLDPAAPIAPVHVDGGAGVDTLEVDDQVSVYIDQAAPEGVHNVIEATGVEIIKIYQSGGSGDIFGGAGGDSLTLYGYSVFHGGAGDDLIVTDGSALGGAGNDTLTSTTKLGEFDGGPGDDVMDPGAVGTISYATATAGVTVDLAITGPQDTHGAGVDTILQAYGIEGSAYADHLFLSDKGGALDGLGGDDMLVTRGGDSGLVGGDGNDTLMCAQGDDGAMGGAGNDIIHGGAGGDSLSGDDGADKVYGEDGNDFIQGGAGPDTLDGGAGFDTTGFSANITSGVTLNLASGKVQVTPMGADLYISIEAVIGTAFADKFIGSAVDESLSGMDGADSLMGGGGNDTLTGGEGADTVRGQAGDDILSGAVVDGGDGVDTLLIAQPGGIFDLSLTTAQQVSSVFTERAMNVENVTALDLYILRGSAADNRLEITGGYGHSLSGAGGDDLLVIHALQTGLDGGDGRDTADLSHLGPLNLTVGTDFVSIEVIVAGGGDDVIHNGDRVGELDGEAGDDSLFGGDLAATLVGGAGDDVLSIHGGGLADGGDGVDLLDLSQAKAGVLLSLGATGAQGTGGAGLLTVAGIEAVTGSNFADTIRGGSGAESISGGSGNDRLSGGGGNDTLHGGVGDDTLAGGGGVDVLAGDGGDDVADLSAATGALNVAVKTSAQTIAGLGTVSFVSIEGIIGSAFADHITGNSLGNLLIGGAGNDTLTGGGGTDTFAFHAGDGNDVILGFTKADLIDLRDATAYQSIQQVGADTRIVVSATDTITLRSFTASDLTAANFHFHVDPNAPESLVGTSHNDILTGGGGDDTIRGLAGDDTLIGGGGADRIDPGNGTNRIDGGDGSDTLDYSHDIFVVTTLIQHTSSGYILNTDQQFADSFTSIENVIGSTGGDTLVGDANANRFDGGGGNDHLYAGDGADALNGGDGNDMLEGDGGADSLTGGAGADEFRFVAITDSRPGAGADFISDFHAAEGDKISLVFIDADPSTTIDDAFHFVSAFTGHAGEATLVYNATTDRTTFSADLNADKVADFQFVLAGHVTTDMDWVL